MVKDIFPKPHKHEIDHNKFSKYKKNLRQKGKRFKAHHNIETFDSKQVLKLLSKKSVTRLGIVQGVSDDGQRVSILAAYNSAGKMVGKAMQVADPCPPPKCSEDA